MKTATFSTGFSDTYKGRRDVKAAWMLVTPEGKIYSGHSLTADAARKTAASYVRYGAPFQSFDRPRTVTVAALQYMHKTAREAGFRDWNAAYADFSAKLAARRAACTLEIIAI